MKRLRLWLWWILNGRDRLDMAWDRIEKLERQNSKLATHLASQQSRVDDLSNQLQAAVKTIESQQQQMEALRLLLTSHEKPKPAPKQARNWREVQALTQGEVIDAPAR